jgi:hypothetical protein
LGMLAEPCCTMFEGFEVGGVAGAASSMHHVAANRGSQSCLTSDCPSAALARL